MKLGSKVTFFTMSQLKFIKLKKQDGKKAILHCKHNNLLLNL